MDIKSQKCTGTLKVSENVIRDITLNVIRETQGIHEYKIPCIGKLEKNSSVSVVFRNGAAEITALVSLAFGCKALNCCEAIQQKIKTNVQDMTGVMVTKVNVKIISLI
ncbi:MAG: Asp23/Gls24 family envelope stress response protein [Oscillospiraceae bacterium]|nr:Asp23/Gls24 family envelope stress response protein [Oscillospiraceae bacterium]